MEKNKEKLFVVGHGTYTNKDNGAVSVYVRLKDVKSGKGFFRSSATKNGTIWVEKGIELEEVKEQYPIGTDVSDELTWGEAIEASKDGEPLTNVYKVELV